MRLLCFLSTILAAPAISQPAVKTMFPVPPGAEKTNHVVLQPKVAEQDYFWIKAEYPSTPALKHYAEIFSHWTGCETWAKDWQSFGDISNGQDRYVQRFTRFWVSPENDRAVTLLFQYSSKGSDSRERPDNDNQYVVVLQHRVPDARAFLAEMKVNCPKAPNPH